MHVYRICVTNCILFIFSYICIAKSTELYCISGLYLNLLLLIVIFIIFQITVYLDKAGSRLNYHRYADVIFDILFAGGILGKI